MRTHDRPAHSVGRAPRRLPPRRGLGWRQDPSRRQVVAEIVELLAEVVGSDNVLVGDDVHADYAHDEALTATPILPLAVVRPRGTAEVAAVLRIADELHVPVTARGSGTGLSGAAISPADGILVS